MDVTGNLIGEVVKQGLGYTLAAYMFVMLIREKDKRITEAQTHVRQDRKLLADIRRLVNTLSRKAGQAK